MAIRFGTEVEKHTLLNLACEYFGEDEVYPICSAKLASKLALNTHTKLLSTWLVTLENPGAYDWQNWFKQTVTTGYKQHEKWTKVSSTDMAINAVVNGHGVTLAVPYLCQRQLDSGELVIPFELSHPALSLTPRHTHYLLLLKAILALKPIKIVPDTPSSTLEYFCALGLLNKILPKLA